MIDREKNRWTGILLLAVFFLLSGALPACGRDADQEQAEAVPDMDSWEQDFAVDSMGAESMNAADPENADGTEPGDGGFTAEDRMEFNEIREMFGENCIAEQTFEVELSEYEGKVWFVPFAPSEENPDFSIQIIQDGEVLWNTQYTQALDAAEGKAFTSLDAVYFGDLNYDDCTDILLIETFGNIQFAGVYYGFDTDAPEYDRYFECGSQLNENIYLAADQMTVPCVVELLTNGKINGGFTSWQEAYTEVSRLYDLEHRHPGEWSEDDIIRLDVEYDLVDVDGDDIPELAAGVNDYFVSLYTYHDGKVYCLMNQWGYGAGGNSGYYYLPGKNRLLNYNTDYAGLILYTTYMTVNSEYTIESETIKLINFDDRNGNGLPDGDEEDSAGDVSVLYNSDGVEITREEYEKEYADWKEDEYEHLSGGMVYEDLQSLLRQADIRQP